MLCDLIYFSERSFACPDTEVVRIVQEASQRNKARGVTGFLIADTRYFIQMVEGDRKTLSVLFDIIQADLRHSDVVLCSFNEIDHREFPDWGMAHVGDPALINSVAAQIIPSGALAPDGLTSEDIKRLLLRARDQTKAAR
jgi:Sensors of blue-light using FAD